MKDIYLSSDLHQISSVHLHRLWWVPSARHFHLHFSSASSKIRDIVPRFGFFPFSKTFVILLTV